MNLYQRMTETLALNMGDTLLVRQQFEEAINYIGEKDMKLTIDELPDGYYKEVLKEAVDKGVAVMSPHQMGTIELAIIGLSEIIRDQQKEIEWLWSALNDKEDIA